MSWTFISRIQFYFFESSSIYAPTFCDWEENTNIQLCHSGFRDLHEHIGLQKFIKGLFYEMLFVAGYPMQNPITALKVENNKIISKEISFKIF